MSRTLQSRTNESDGSPQNEDAPNPLFMRLRVEGNHRHERRCRLNHVVPSEILRRSADGNGRIVDHETSLSQAKNKKTSSKPAESTIQSTMKRYVARRDA